MANREYKDSLFRFLFNDPMELCSLYHAISPETNVTDKDIQINTLDSILMDRLKNDISFLTPHQHVILMEQQSTWCPNIPLRCLWYACDLYRHLIPNKKAMYSSRLIRIPTPWFYVFYIGDSTKPYESTLCLSDAFPATSGRLELLVTVYNITYDPNCPILKKCRTLCDYSRFIHEIERRRKHMTLDRAIHETMKCCAEHGILDRFIHNHYEEVCNMVNLWYDEKEAREYWREEALEDGRKEGREETQKNTALDMLRDRMDPEKVMKYTKLSPECIAELAKTL